MKDKPIPLVGPVYGFRAWTVETDGDSKWTTDHDGARLVSFGNTRWDDARQRAECVSTDDGGIFGPLRTMMWGETRLDEPHEPATSSACWCGLYAHTTLGRCIETNLRKSRNLRYFLEDEGWPTSKVLGLVRAWGHMHAADRGFRASDMAIDTLVCLHRPRTLRPTAHRTIFTRNHQPHVRDIAADLGVDVVCARLTKQSLGRAFANREGVYLWRKEAPWTSDITPEPTKSSTPPKPAGRTFSWDVTSPDPSSRKLTDWQESISRSVESTFLRDGGNSLGGGAA